MKRLLLLWVLQSLVFGQQSANPDEKASVEGVVVNEISGAPVKKAEVTLQVAGTQIAAATTDENGHFAIDGIPPGECRIDVWHRNFVPGDLRGREVGINLTLKPGEKKKDISIGLVPGVAISGRVLNEDGEPLRGCRIQVLRTSHRTMKKQFEEVSSVDIPVTSLHMYTKHNGENQYGLLTNDLGEYQIFNLPAGRFFLHAACGHQPPTTRPYAAKGATVKYNESAYEEQFYPGTPDLSGAVKLNLTPGAEMREVDFLMRRVRVVSVRGRISVASGPESYQGLLITAIQKNQVGLPQGDKTAWVQQSGEFEIHGLRPGSYVLWPSNVMSGDPRQIMGHYDIEVADLQIKDVVIALNEGAALTGTVQWESAVRHPGQPGFAGEANVQRIWLTPTGEYKYMSSGVVGTKAEVKEDGTFSFPSVLPGEWELVYQPAPSGAFVKSLRLGDQEVSANRFTMPQGAAGPLRVLIGMNGAEISGTVHSDEPRGDGGNLLVVLWPDGGLLWPENLHNIPIDEKGDFTVTGIPPGRYHIYAMEMKAGAEIPTMDRDFLKAIESRSEEVSVAEGDHVTKELKVIPPEVIADALKEIE